MNLAAAALDLRELATGTDHRSTMAQFRDVFTDVQAALDAGVRRLAVRDLLASHGLNLPMNTLKSMIYRLRREQGIARPPGWRGSAAKRALAETGGATAVGAVHTAQQPATATDNPTSAPDASSAARPVSTLREATAASLPSKPSLPDNWMTGRLTPEQHRSLTAEQRVARERARREKYFPNPLKGWKPGEPLKPLATGQEQTPRDDVERENDG
ncbi:hypothetical protein N0A02_33700 (plasmid) [Paraburkholderia acidicola]|uniref:Uncharacterized protein n=1 Tax=Paraburkholderia acidicola TaxID=1912599 RepID=A0ABV1LYK9_9BURK